MLITLRMTKNPITATPEMTIHQAAKIMKQEGIRRLPVLDSEKKLVGIITEGDINLAAPSAATTLSAYEISYLLDTLTVSKIMSKNPVTVQSDTSIEEAAHVMFDHDFSCLPIMEGDKLVGIVTKKDMFKMLLEMLGSRAFGTRVEFLVEDKPGVIAKISTAFAEKGLNIVAFATFAGDTVGTSICTIKVEGSASEQVREIITPFVLEVIDIREF